MKISSLAVVGSVVWTLGIAGAVAENAPRQAAAAEQQRDQFSLHLTEASRLFQMKRIPDSLKELEKADAIFGDSPEVHNLRGSCHVESRDFAKALEEFQKADALLPGNTGVSFNIAEVHFVEHRWEEAVKAFGALQPKVAAGDATLAALVDLKLLVCHCKLGALEDAGALAAKRAGDPATPFSWYAKAVMEFENRNRAAAAGFLVDVKAFHPDLRVNAPFRDTLVEARYVKN